MGGRAVVTLVHLLDSAASNSPASVEAGEDDATTEAVRQPTIADPVASSQTTIPAPEVSSCPSTPVQAVSNLSSIPLPDDDTPIPKKKRGRSQVCSVLRRQLLCWKRTC